MKVLLINPGFAFAKFGSFNRFMEPMPCIGLASIAAVLEQDGVEVQVIDEFLERLGTAGLVERIKQGRFDIVGISCVTPSAPMVFSLARAIKSYDKRITVVIGNAHASVFADEILREEKVDVVVHGEGEYAMRDVVRSKAGKGDLLSIKGISFKQGGKVVHTGPAEIIEDLDALPYPAWHLFPFEHYASLPLMDVKKPGLSVMGSRGCPYRCRFCSLSKTAVKYRERDPVKVVDEIEFIANNFKVRQVCFVDPIFPYSKKTGMKFASEMVKRGLNKRIVWVSETRVDRVDRELIRALKESGCGRLMYGLESGVQGLLDNVNKDFSIECARDAVRIAREEGLQVAGVFMIGLPGETREMTQQTIDFTKETDLDFAKFAITVPFPGSKLYDDLVSAGKLSRRDWENYTTFNTDPKALVYVPGNQSAEELLRMQKSGHRQFYLRPKMVFRQIFCLRSVSIKNILFGFLSLIRKH